MPYECAADPQNPGELGEHAPVVGRVGEKAKRCEQVQDRIESVRPILRHPAHVAPPIVERRPDATFACASEQILREIQSVNTKAGLGEQMGVAALPAGDVEDARADVESENFDEPRDFLAIALEGEQRLIFSEVLIVEVGRPPVGNRYRARCRVNDVVGGC